MRGRFGALPLAAALAAACASAGATSVPGGEVGMGTTIVAVRYAGGVVVGADTRTSASGYVSNRAASKLTFVLDREADSFVRAGPAWPGPAKGGGGGEPQNGQDDDQNGQDGQLQAQEARAGYTTCCVCRSGSAADTQHLADMARADLLARQVARGGSGVGIGTVSGAAHLLRGMVRAEPDLSASLICAGYDHVEGRGMIYSIAPGGTLVEEPGWTVQGSGSGYILGHLDEAYPRGGADALDEDEAVALVAGVVRLAMERDGSSGGFVRMFVIGREGKRAIVLPMARDGRGVPGDDEGGDGDGPGGRPQLKGFAPASSPGTSNR